MTARPKGIVIVTLNATDDIDGLKRRISQIVGVNSTNFDNLTHKLLVHYEGDDPQMSEIKVKIDKLLEGSSIRAHHDELPTRRKLQPKRRKR